MSIYQGKKQITSDGTGSLGADGLSITDTDKLNLLEGDAVLSTVTLPGGGSGSVNLFHDITRNGQFLDSEGAVLPSGEDSTDGIGNADAHYNTVIYENETYYWIQNRQVPIRSSIIRINNITDGMIVATKNY